MQLKQLRFYFCGFILGLLLTNIANAAKPTDPKVFVQELVQKPFNYDYQNYDSQLKDASTYFSQTGWDKYKDALDKSGILKSIIAGKQSMSGKMISPVTLSTSENLIQANVIVNVAYKSGNQEITTKENVNVLLKDTSQGLRVENVIVAIAK